MNGFIESPVSKVVVLPPQQATQQFKHRFGGASPHRGIVPAGNTQPLHLVYLFDCSDPLVPVRIEGVRFLPLYYCFPYHAGAVSYRVISDEEIEIIYLEDEDVAVDFPFPNFPNTFPEVPVGLEAISETDYEMLVPYVTADRWYADELEENRQHLQRSGYPFTQLGGVQRMWQGVPDAACQNQQCDNYTDRICLDVFAVVWNQPVPEVYLFDDDSDDEYRDDEGVQVIFQICPRCQAIYVCNRCT